MPPRDPQPGEKYRFRKRKAIDYWEFLEVLEVALETERTRPEMAVRYRPVVSLPEQGVEPYWGRRVSEVPLRVWRLAVTHGGVHALPADWEPHSVPKPPKTDTDRVRDALAWAVFQPSSPAITELLDILRKP